MTKRIVLIDDHHLVRAGLRSLIECIPGYEVVAEGSDGSEAMALLEREDPDILMTDIAMPRVSGLDILPEVRERFPDLPVIVLSMHASKEIVISALKAGASGYLVKDAAEAELELALNAVVEGHQYLSPRVSKEVFDAMMARRAGEASVSEKSTLTQRQLEILRLIALGKSAKEIAYDLGVSSKTVESHRTQLMERLEIRDIPTLVRYAIREGIISLNENI
ncbi:response regulator [Marinobacter sp.]|uniref:response regulator n=1 Tax=Marinobacter sp. TaxID=50741 RepID=UPI00384D900A